MFWGLEFLGFRVFRVWGFLWVYRGFAYVFTGVFRIWLPGFPNLAAAFSECGLLLILNFPFVRTGRIWKRRKKSLAGERDVIVRFQGCFPNLAAAFSESGCGVFRMLPRRFPNVSVASSNRAGRFVNAAVAFSNLFAECDVAHLSLQEK